MKKKGLNLNFNKETSHTKWIKGYNKWKKTIIRNEDDYNRLKKKVTKND